jgi:hypothetical protein
MISGVVRVSFDCIAILISLAELSDTQIAVS